MGGSSTFFMASSMEVLENDLWVKHTYRPLLHCIPRKKHQGTLRDSDDTLVYNITKHNSIYMVL